MTKQFSRIMSVYIHADINAVEEQRFELSLPKIYFHCAQSDFYLNMCNHNAINPAVDTNLLDLFCIRFGVRLASENFRSKEWRELLNQIRSPYLTERIVAEYNRSHKYEVSKTRYMSDDDNVVKYCYPIYKTLLCDFDYRYWFSYNDVTTMMRDLYNAFHESYVVRNLYKEPLRYFKTDEIKQLCSSFVFERDELYKIKPINNKLIPEFCKQMIILHYNFITKYEQLVAKIVS